MKRILLLVACFLCLSIITKTSAQVTNINNMTETEGSMSNTKSGSQLDNEYTRNLRLQEMKKTTMNYFLNDKWQGGVVYLNNDNVLKGSLFRYNIYTDQIELRSFLNPEDVDVVSIGSQKFIYSRFIDEEGRRDAGYFELLEDGETKLLLRRYIKFEVGMNDIKAYGASSSTGISENYYIKKEGEPAQLVEKDKESLIKVLSDKAGMEDFINKSFVIFVTEKKLRKFINHYNTL